MRTVKTICQMCYFYCGLNVTVDQERIVKIEGMKEHPVNHGRLCAKGLAAAQLVSDPKRLQKPLRRVGSRGSGRWAEVNWDEALDEIADRFMDIREKTGPERVGYYRGHAPGWVTNYNYVIRFMNSWGSPNIFTHAHLCFAPRAVAHAATFGGFPEPDYERAAAIMLIGYNPVFTSPVNYAPRIIWAKERGAKLIVVDPRFTNTAAKADLFLQPRPGTTGALVLAMIHTIIEEGLFDRDFIETWTVGFEELARFVHDYSPMKVAGITWVPADRIKQAATMIGRIKPALIVDGNGLDQHTNTVQTVRTTSILRALLKTVDEPGGSILMPLLPFFDVQRRGDRPQDFGSRSVMQYPLYYGFGQTLTGVEMTDALAKQTPYPIEALIVQGGDPVAVLSETDTVRSIFDHAELIVVHDLYHTATAQIADFVLPAAGFLERDLILYYRYRPFADGNMIAMQNRCVQPVGESRSDLDFIFSLAKRVGLHEHFLWADALEAFDQELAVHGIDIEWLRKNPGGYVRRYPPEELYRKYKKTGFNTPSGKIEFYASRFKQAGMDPLPAFIEPALSPISRPDLVDQYPLVCSTGLKLGIHTHTQFRSLPWIREMEPDPFGEIHPQTAADAGIVDGDWMIVESPVGRIKVRARCRFTVHPQVVMVTNGYGEPYAGGGDLVNRITGEKERDPICGATGNRSFLCRILPERT